MKSKQVHWSSPIRSLLETCCEGLRKGENIFLYSAHNAHNVRKLSYQQRSARKFELIFWANFELMLNFNNKNP